MDASYKKRYVGKSIHKLILYFLGLFRKYKLYIVISHQKIKKQFMWI
jgi:hypothetical protein